MPGRARHVAPRISADRTSPSRPLIGLQPRTLARLDRAADWLWVLFPPLVIVGESPANVVVALLGALWAVRFAARGRTVRGWPAGLALPLACWGLWILYAALLVVPTYTDLRDVVAKDGLVLVLPLAFAEGFTPRRARRSVMALLVGAAILFPYMLWGYLRPGYGRAEAFSGGAPNLGTNLMDGAVLYASFALAATGAARAWLGAAAGLLLGGIALTLNRAALVGAAVGIGWPAARRSPALLLAGLLGLVAASAAFPASIPVARLRSILVVSDTESAQERVKMWKAGLRMVRDRPLLGLVGRRRFMATYPAYRLESAREPRPGHLHNSLLQPAILHGVPGLGLMLWWMAVLARHARARMRWPVACPAVAPADDPRPLALAVAPFLVAAACNAQFDFIIADGQRAILLWGLLGLLLSSTPLSRRIPHR